MAPDNADHSIPVPEGLPNTQSIESEDETSGNIVGPDVVDGMELLGADMVNSVGEDVLLKDLLARIPVPVDVDALFIIV